MNKRNSNSGRKDSDRKRSGFASDDKRGSKKDGEKRSFGKDRKESSEGREYSGERKRKFDDDKPRFGRNRSEGDDKRSFSKDRPKRNYGDRENSGRSKRDGDEKTGYSDRFNKSDRERTEKPRYSDDRRKGYGPKTGREEKRYSGRRDDDKKFSKRFEKEDSRDERRSGGRRDDDRAPDKRYNRENSRDRKGSVRRDGGSFSGEEKKFSRGRSKDDTERGYSGPKRRNSNEINQSEEPEGEFRENRKSSREKMPKFTKGKPDKVSRGKEREKAPSEERARPKTKKFNKIDQELIGNWREERPVAEGNENRDSYRGKAEITEELRLNKYLANSGLCSRRDADGHIENGSVSVNGVIVKELGVKVKPGDEVRFKGRLVIPEKTMYILMNKPKDCITSADDPEGRRTVIDLLDPSIEERVFPVGRLDRNTTGVILLTNDGDLAQKLTHPSFGVHKVYKADLDKPMAIEDMEKLAAGIELEDGFIQPDSIAYVDETRTSIGLEIHSGKNHIVHRMFNHLGYLVDKLDRVSFAGLTKDRIKRGEYRFLTEKEVLTLRRASEKRKS